MLQINSGEHIDKMKFNWCQQSTRKTFLLIVQSCKLSGSTNMNRSAKVSKPLKLKKDSPSTVYANTV